jgi:uncharacterized protein (TIGR03435 family)
MCYILSTCWFLSTSSVKEKIAMPVGQNLILVFLSLAVYGQVPEEAGPKSEPLRFDVASVKIDTSGDEVGAIKFAGDRLSLSHVTLDVCLRTAFEVKEYELRTPAWLSTVAVNIAARAAGPVSRPQAMAMFRTLLAERFHLQTHREVRELPVYNLEVTKAGPKLSLAASDALPSALIYSRDPRNWTMDDLALFLSVARDLNLGRPVINKTELLGRFHFVLQYDRDPLQSSQQPDVNAKPTIFAALEALGLRLAAGKGTIPLVVVDSIDRFPTPEQ